MTTQSSLLLPRFSLRTVPAFLPKILTVPTPSGETPPNLLLASLRLSFPTRQRGVGPGVGGAAAATVRILTILSPGVGKMAAPTWQPPTAPLTSLPLAKPGTCLLLTAQTCRALVPDVTSSATFSRVNVTAKTHPPTSAKRPTTCPIALKEAVDSHYSAPSRHRRRNVVRRCCRLGPRQ